MQAGPDMTTLPPCVSSCQWLFPGQSIRLREKSLIPCLSPPIPPSLLPPHLTSLPARSLPLYPLPYLLVQFAP